MVSEESHMGGAPETEGRDRKEDKQKRGAAEGRPTARDT